MVTLTAKAAKRAAALLAREGKPGGVLRLRILSGGCSGLSYDFQLAEAPGPEDKLFERDGSRLAVDPKALRFVEGATVDYVQTLMQAGFEVSNPNADASCSCGVSFTPKEYSFLV